MHEMTRRTAALAAAMLVLLSSVGVAMAAGGLVYDSDTQAPNPAETYDSVTIATHDVDEMDPLDYEGDSGQIQTLDATVNESTNNTYGYSPVEIDASEFAEFPRNGETDNAASWADASEWSVSDSNISVSETTTAPNVDALNVAATSVTSGSSYTATYNNFSVDSDEAKRYGQFGVRVNTLDSAAHVEVRVNDEDGDYKAFTIDPDADQSNASVIANATGDHVVQTQLGQLATQGSGDGTFNNIESVTVVVQDGDFDGSFTLMNAEKMSEYDFGDHRYQADDDDELETETVTDPHGEVRVDDLSTLGDTFDTAEIKDLTVYDIRFEAAGVSSADVNVTRSEVGDTYPGYAWTMDIQYKLSAPSAYDLSYSGGSIEAEQALPENRYIGVGYADGVGSTDWADISYTDSSSVITEEGSTYQLSNAVTPGEIHAVEYELKLTADDMDSIYNAGAVVMAGDDGGFFSGIWGWITGALGSLGVFLGLRRAGS